MRLISSTVRRVFASAKLRLGREFAHVHDVQIKWARTTTLGDTQRQDAGFGDGEERGSMSRNGMFKFHENCSWAFGCLIAKVLSCLVVLGLENEALR